MLIVTDEISGKVKLSPFSKLMDGLSERNPQLINHLIHHPWSSAASQLLGDQSMCQSRGLPSQLLLLSSTINLFYPSRVAIVNGSYKEKRAS